METYVAAGVALIGGITIGAFARWSSRRPSEGADEPRTHKANVIISLLPDGGVMEPTAAALLVIDVSPDTRHR